MLATDILFDANYLCYYQIHSILREKPRFFDLPDMETIFLKNFLGTVCSIVNFNDSNLDKIMFAFDAKHNWRYEATKEFFVYKDREEKKAKKIDIPKTNYLIERAMQFCKDLNFFVFVDENLEADDWVMLLANNNWLINKSTLIISGDSDLTQLLRRNDEKFISQYSILARKYMIAKDTINDDDSVKAMDDIDEMFFDSMPETGGSSHIADRTDNDADLINPVEVVFIKSTSGDLKDSIPSSFIYQSKSNTPISFGKKRAENLFNAKYKDTLTLDDMVDIYHDELRRKKIASDILEACNKTDLDLIPKIADDFKRNIRLVFLNQHIIGDELVNPAAVDIQDQLNNATKIALHRMMFKNGAFYAEYLYKGTQYDFTLRSYHE